MKNLTQEEKDYILKVLNYDLKIAKIELDGWEKSLQNTKHITYSESEKKQIKTWKAELESKAEFLTNLINKL